MNSPAAVARISNHLMPSLAEGNSYLDTTAGCPWLQGVIGKHNQATADATFQDFVLNVQGVVDLAAFSSVVNPAARQYSANMTIDTLYGQTPAQISTEQLF